MRPDKVYLVWNGPYGSDGESYYTQYNSLADALDANGDGCEIYVAKVKRLGKFKRKNILVRIKARKKRKT